jgi:hypothetical protein
VYVFSQQTWCEHTVVQLVQTLSYRPQSRGFDSRWCPSARTMALVSTVSNRNDYQNYLLGSKGGWCVGLTTYHLHVPTVLKSASLKLLEPSGIVQGLFTNAYGKLRI